MDLLILLGALGAWEIVAIIAVALLLFGGRKIPELMKGVGSGIREFKKASAGDYDKDEPAKKIEEKK